MAGRGWSFRGARWHRHRCSRSPLRRPPRRAVDAVVAGLFVFGAADAWREGTKPEEQRALREASRHGVVLTAFIVILLAECGDLTQIVTANLAAKYHSPLSVGVGSLLALWSVAAIAVVGGQGDRGVECPGSTRARRSRRRTTPR
jgi:putative Ca2+/H+ antiporter (TMEM165/GDT1 family)